MLSILSLKLLFRKCATFVLGWSFKSSTLFQQIEWFNDEVFNSTFDELTDKSSRDVFRIQANINDEAFFS